MATTSHSFVRFLSLCAIIWCLYGVVRGESVPSFASTEEALLHWEGRSLTPYQDVGASVSVGIGHSLTAHRDSARDRYTDDQVNTFFVADIANSLRICRKGVEDFDSLPERVRQATMSLAYQCGATGFLRFQKFRWLLSRRAYNAAAVELCQSKWFRTGKDVRRINWTIATVRRGT